MTQEQTIPTIIAHRSNNGETPLPENTLIALKRAHDNGCEWVECDVHLSADKIVFLLHDDTLRRTTNASDVIADQDVGLLSYSQIASVDAGIKYGDAFANEKIPTLSEFLSLLKSYDMGLLLEIKPSINLEKETAAQTIAILQEMELLDYPKLLVQSFNINCLEIARAEAEDLKLGLIISELSIFSDLEQLRRLEQLRCTAIVANYELLTKSTIKKLKELTPSLLAWTVNDPNVANTLRRNGVDGLITDHPERLLMLDEKLENTFAFFKARFQKTMETDVAEINLCINM